MRASEARRALPNHTASHEPGRTTHITGNVHVPSLAGDMSSERWGAGGRTAGRVLSERSAGSRNSKPGTRVSSPESRVTSHGPLTRPFRYPAAMPELPCTLGLPRDASEPRRIVGDAAL